MRRRTAVSMMLVTLLVIFGCATYGKIRPMGQELTIEMLTTNWQNYDVYWTGLSEMKPTAILFDPKNDERTLAFERDNWSKVKNEDALSMVVGGSQANWVFYPVLYRLLGPDDGLYGYIYTGYWSVVTKPVDQKTLWVYNLPGRLEGENKE
jgi:hypothetical protein